jgi:4-hydroxybutyrate CoA-transferase
MPAAAEAARVVIAEVNARMPYTYGDTRIHQSRFTATVTTSRPLQPWPEREYGETERRIAQYVADLVQDGDTIQVGIGGIPSAVLDALKDRRDLGVHSGLITDGIVELIERGAVTNRRKNVDTGVTTGNWLLGTDRLHRWADRNPLLSVRSAEYVHGAHVIAGIENFRAINSGLEVDLTGQVNAEIAGSYSVGGVGGLADFVRGALMSSTGRSIVALPSTARGGQVSRIVPRIESGVVTVPRYDADYVVTEWGIAHLRGKSLEERARELVAVAHPDFRDELQAGSRRLL